uniref:Nodal modulator 1 n=1 Tax=Ascaris suum TaxID=6253 RepID=F1KRP9_ASCSU
MRQLHDSIYMLLIAAIWRVVSAEVYSCGGFVKSANIPIDYTKIQVKLLTAEGNLKYETECNPSNGYYMIPVYNKAVYSIRVFAPEGWYFEPSSVELKVDGKEDACFKGDDINFVLSAFAVDGVLRSGEGGGPAGVTLTLSAENGTVIAKTATVANGHYSFRAPPGKYLVSTADGSTECIERGKVPAEVIASPIRVSPDLKISGHLMSVAVHSKTKPLPGVLVSLYSKNPVNLSYCKGKASNAGSFEGVPTEEKLICSLETGSNGAALFPCLPPGKYSIVPSLSTSNVRFTFLPKVYSLLMESAPTKVNFNMEGFSSRGRVVLGETPVIDAQIIVNGHPRAHSDANGWYALDGLQEEEYSITAKKDHFEFDVVNARLSAAKAEIADIIAKKVELCGYVEMEGDISRAIVIFITNKNTNDPQSARSDTNGRFCKMLPPQQYIVSPSNEVGIVMTPKQREVDLSTGPILNVLFTQFKANILAKVVCLDRCDALKVELWNGDELIRSVEGMEQFRFIGVPPDSYTLKVVDGGRFCWEKNEIIIAIERTDVNNVIFRQNGYRATVRLSHPAKMKWHLSEKKQLGGAVDLGSGTSNFCVPLAGVYSLSFEACHVFDHTLYEISVPQESPLTATAVSFLTTAKIISRSSPAMASDFALLVKSASDERTITASSSSDGGFTFEFYVSASDMGSAIAIIPQSSTYLFTPTSHIFQFDGECHPNVASFVADKGVFLEGFVTPPLEGVEIRSSHRADPNLVLKTVTDSEGRFKMGPVRNVADFELLAEKEGYKFEKGEKLGVLHAVKLSQLRIALVDADSAEPLSRVLLSLSGVDSYRSNSLIDESGKINFVGLKPGEYFVRPILQEYRFEPPTLTLNVKEGEVESVTLKGRRFAYSVFGRVTRLAGQPVESAVVEAVSEQCSQLQEEDSTSEEGTYRVRGLHPKCLYRLTLKTSDGQRIQSYPTHYDVMVTGEDVRDVNFVLTHIERHLEVVGEVDFINTKSPSQYKIGLYKGDTAVQQVIVNSPSSIFFFTKLPIDHTEYTVRFEGVHGFVGHKYDSSEASFIANDSFKAIKLVVKPQRKSSEVEISGGSYFALPFFLFIAFLFFNHQKALAIAESTILRVSNFTVPRRSPTPPDEHPDSIRRRQKAKKA